MSEAARLANGGREVSNLDFLTGAESAGLAGAT
jgi:hypothetical protein